MKRASNPPALSLVPPERDLAAELDQLCREQISRIVQEYLVLEVDALLQRARYERGAKAYRNGFDDPRVITTSAGPITIRRPRVRGAKTESKILPSTCAACPAWIVPCISFGSKAWPRAI